MLTLLFSSLLEAMRGSNQVFRGLSLLFAAGQATLLVLIYRQLGHVTPRLSTLALAAAGLVAAESLIGDFVRLRTRAFTVTLLLPVVLAVMDFVSGVRGAPSSATVLQQTTPTVQVILAFCIVNVVVHALYAVWPAPTSDRQLSGMANTRPSSLWAIWLAQGLVLGGFAAALIWARQHAHLGDVFLKTAIDAAYLPLHDYLEEIYPSYLIAMALFSFSGMQASREWVWKARCSIFAAFYATLLLDMLFVWNDGVFRWWTPVVAIFPLVMLAVHLWYLRQHREWFSEEVGEGPDGWVAVDLLLGPLMLLRTLLWRRRASFARGVAASGTFQVLPRDPTVAPGYPDHDFFRRGQPRPVQIRFSNERSGDDAAADVRGAALRLSTSERSPFDLLLSTGAYGAAENIVEHALITMAGILGRPGHRRLASVQQFREGGIAALRRAPESFATLSYHSKSVRFWVGSKNERYLVRYRLVPADRTQQETGLPISRADFVDRRRSPTERRPMDYLRRELKMRLEGHDGTREAHFRLQGQFHSTRYGDGDDWYNPATDWNADQYPWIDLAELILDSVLPDDQAEALSFNSDNAPFSLGTPISQGIFDHRSIADSERRVMRRAHELRRWMGTALGLPTTNPKPVD